MVETAPSLPQSHRLHRIELFGLWGYRDYSISVNPEVNFFIGPNGCGKTTIINMVTSALRPRLNDFIPIEFDLMRLVFSAEGKRSNPVLQIKKSKASDGISTELNIQYFEQTTQKEPELDETITQAGGIATSLSPVPNLTSLSDAFIKKIRDLTELKLLSIHRTDPDHEQKAPSPWAFGAAEKTYDSTVDQSLAEIRPRFMEYLSEIDTKISERSKKFEIDVFRSLTLELSDLVIKNVTFDENQLEVHRDTVATVFYELGLQPNEIRSSLDKLIKSTQMSLDKFVSKGGIDLGDIARLASVHQSPTIAKIWTRYQEDVKNINFEKDQLISMFSRFFRNKKMFIHENANVYFFVDRDNHPAGDTPLRPDQLSSGEKQIYIFLMEAILQRNKSLIYFADEPELSLHVSWQEVLVDSLRNLNPNAQLIFATHSPDIVSSYANGVIDLG